VILADIACNLVLVVRHDHGDIGHRLITGVSAQERAQARTKGLSAEVPPSTKEQQH